MGNSEDYMERAFRSRDPHALEYAIQEYGRALYALASRILAGLGNSEDIEECVSDVFVEAWAKAEHYDKHRGSLRTWLLLLTKYKALDYRRKLYKRTDTAVLSEELPSKEADIEHTLLTLENSREILRAVNGLPEPDRQMVYQRYYYYETLENIAQSFGLTKKAVENRLYRSRTQLRRQLSLWFKGEPPHDGQQG